MFPIDLVSTKLPYNTVVIEIGIYKAARTKFQFLLIRTFLHS